MHTFSSLFKISLPAFLLYTVGACSPLPTSAPTCPDDRRVVFEGRTYCIIDGEADAAGVECPPDLEHRLELSGEEGAVCSAQTNFGGTNVDMLRSLLQADDDQWFPNPGSNPSSCTGSDPSKHGCDSDADCGAGESCQPDESACRSTSCECNPGLDAWACTSDCQELFTCQPSEEAEAEPTCTEPDPSLDCQTTGCGEEERCEENYTSDACVPSSCTCDASLDLWACTKDCGPVYQCQPIPVCEGINPANDFGCRNDSDCETGEVCRGAAELGIECGPPSECWCETGNYWYCYDDCPPPQQNVCVEAGD